MSLSFTFPDVMILRQQCETVSPPSDPINNYFNILLENGLAHKELTHEEFYNTLARALSQFWNDIRSADYMDMMMDRREKYIRALTSSDPEFCEATLTILDLINRKIYGED